jgi:anti-repressor protein
MAGIPDSGHFPLSRLVLKLNQLNKLSSTMIEIHKSKKGTPFVIASDLHRELEIGTPLAIWFPRMIEYGFTENIDYYQFNINVKLEQGGNTVRYDWSVHIEMAKHIAMIQRSTRGKALREYFLDLERKRNQGELLTREQIIALIEITNVLGLFSMQEYLHDEHFNVFTLTNKPNEWWAHRAWIFGFSAKDLREMVEALGKKYRNQQQALFHIDKFELVRIATVDLFMAMGKSQEYALNIGRTAEDLSKTMGIEIYDDRDLPLNFTTERQKNMIDQIKNRRQKETLLDKF